MQLDFHYYATYCAAYLAGHSHRESLEICYSAQFTDCCSSTLLSKIRGPQAAATTQLQLELMDARTDVTGLQNITRIWSSFHFLPRDLYAKVNRRCSRYYKNKYRLICGPNGALLKDTVELARGRGTQAAGIAMHVLADTWAHRYFAGTPSLVINNTNYYFYELMDEGGTAAERQVSFRHDPSREDDLVRGIYNNSLSDGRENTIMVLGHGRAGHLPDYSFMRYKYLPAWGDYEEIVKDNPTDYYQAFCQMIYAMKYLRQESRTQEGGAFETGRYDWLTAAPLEKEIRAILTKRQLSAAADWKALGEKMSGEEIPEFDQEKYQAEYRDAPEEAKKDTFLGKFFMAAMRQKSMVTTKIFESGNLVAGYSVDFAKKRFQGIREYIRLAEMLNMEKEDPETGSGEEEYQGEAGISGEKGYKGEAGGAGRTETQERGGR